MSTEAQIRIWPPRIRHVTLGRSRLRVDIRTTAVAVVLTLVTVAVAILSLTLGSVEGANLPLDRVVGAFTGTESEAVQRIVVEGRLPRVLVAVFGGAALALSGAIFQTVTRNPLGSPDIIGFTSGANTGALVALLVLNLGYTGATVGSLIGGLVTGAVIYLLALRGGNLNGSRLIIVGIGLSAMLVAFNGFLLARANVENAVTAAAWGQGIFEQLRFADVLPVAIVLLILTPALVALAPGMRMFELGTDSARSKGVHTQRVQLLLLAVAVGFVAVVTAVAGPIAFIALIAPQVAMRLSRSPGIPLVTSAAVGATLLVVSDAIARTMLAPVQLPVGVVTTALGGIYLLGLLIVQSRKATV
ncbi:FecCD family ABC transporter permease [Cumulibacter soli]|uniref:FecCD family ABC transporter permease n=1 Tax=Cumulibacter soli TaxID=2546344 RepID=UPI0010679D10|nr:iron chelate uptake ABC transporter family permease subunit [Cumulibacter soli]